MDLWLRTNTYLNRPERRMPANVTVILSEAERDQLVRSLVIHQALNPALHEIVPLIRQIAAKLAAATEGPNITIGVHGGVVQ